MYGSGVAEQVGRDAPGLLAIPVQEAGMPAYDLVDPEPGKGLARTRAEHRPRSASRRIGFLQQHPEMTGRFGPERASPPLVALAMQSGKGLIFEVQVFCPKIGHLLSPCPGVVKHRQ